MAGTLTALCYFKRLEFIWDPVFIWDPTFNRSFTVCCMVYLCCVVVSPVLLHFMWHHSWVTLTLWIFCFNMAAIPMLPQYEVKRRCTWRLVATKLKSSSYYCIMEQMLTPEQRSVSFLACSWSAFLYSLHYATVLQCNALQVWFLTHYFYQFCYLLYIVVFTQNL